MMMCTGVFNFSTDIYGIVTTDNEIFNIMSYEDSNNAFEEDIIQYDKSTNKIINIIKRSDIIIPGVLQLSSRTIYGFTKKGVPKKKFIPLNKKIPHFLVGTKHGYQVSDVYATVKFIEWNKDGKCVHGILDRIIGNVGDYNSELDFLKDRYSIRWKKINLDLTKYTIDLTTDRINFNDKYVISIDPINCTDIDDAIHFKEYEEYIELGIHIADVSAYIKENSELDMLIRTRGESIYMYHQQINMLPDNLATDIYSLLEGVERKTFTTLYKLDKKDYTILSVDFMKSTIINKKKYSYENAQYLINSTDNKSIFSNILKKMYDIGKIWYLNKFPNSIYNVHKMIEIFMLTTNIKVANKLAEEIKDKVILRSQNGFTSPLIKDDNISEDIINRVNIYKLDSAKYCVGINNSSHILLDEKYYTHFTSPIRRYSDIIVHRMLYNCLIGNKESIPFYNNICNYLNDNHKKIKTMERESIILDTIYNKLKCDNLTIDTFGYIINIRDNILLVFIPYINTDVECKLFSNTVRKLINYESCEENIKITIGEHVIILKLFQKIEIKLIVSMKAPKIRKKLLVQIIDPKIDIFLSLKS